MYNNSIIKKFINKTNEIITKELYSDVSLINEIAKYIIYSGGKRLRPLTTILSGHILGFNDEILFRQAAMIEFIHTSTLLHDDVVDNSNLRRGKKTANNIFGNAASILVGDFLYSRAFQIMVSSNNMDIMKLMANTTNTIATGEVLQLINIANVNITEDEYFKVIKNKTAVLFAAAAQIGAIIAKANKNIENNLKEFGLNLGLAFQIIDDVLDYSGDIKNIGKNIGDDLAEGKTTLPLIYLIHNESKEISDFVKKALTEANRDYFNQIHDYVVNSSALDYCYNKAKEIINKAKNHLNNLPQNEYTEILENILVDSINRIS